MHKEGVLKSLGCRGLPASALPPSQNMMEWKPTTVPYRTARRFESATVVPSQRYVACSAVSFKCIHYTHCRHTTLEALGSLPLPDESAQAMVVKGSSTLTKRRESISQYIKRKLSKPGGSRRGYRKEGGS